MSKKDLLLQQARAIIISNRRVEKARNSRMKRKRKPVARNPKV